MTRTNMSASRADQSSIGGEKSGANATQQSMWWGNVVESEFGGKPTVKKATHLSSTANCKVMLDDNIKQFNTKHGDRSPRLR
jgi:hypothetical protein